MGEVREGEVQLVDVVAAARVPVSAVKCLPRLPSRLGSVGALLEAVSLERWVGGDGVGLSSLLVWGKHELEVDEAPKGPILANLETLANP